MDEYLISHHTLHRKTELNLFTWADIYHTMYMYLSMMTFSSQLVEVGCLVGGSNEEVSKLSWKERQIT
jgi:hypothetical protein